MSQITYYNEIYNRNFFSKIATFASTCTVSLKHIDRMFQFKQCKTEHDSNYNSLEYVFKMFDSKYLSEMFDYDDFEIKIFIFREINKINFVILFHEKFDDSIVLFNVMKTRKRQKKNNNSNIEKNIQQKRIVDFFVDKFKKKTEKNQKSDEIDFENKKKV